MKRYALVSLHNSDRKQVEAYLPANYEVVGFAPHDSTRSPDGRYLPTEFGPCLVIEGEDNCGWTLDGYVIPRLASGLHAAAEIGADHPVVVQLTVEREVAHEEAANEAYIEGHHLHGRSL
jgi:hypothetical protein